MVLPTIQPLRLKKVLRDNGVPIAVAAKAVGLSLAYFYQILNGATKATKRVEALLEELQKTIEGGAA